MVGHALHAIKYSIYKLLTLRAELSCTDFSVCPHPHQLKTCSLSFFHAQIFIKYKISARYKARYDGQAFSQTQWGSQASEISFPCLLCLCSLCWNLRPELLQTHRSAAFFPQNQNPEDGFNLVKGSTINCGQAHNFTFRS